MTTAQIDPVCGMAVERSDAPRRTFATVEYRFCSQMCRRAFDERPGRYLKGGNHRRFETIRRGAAGESQGGTS